MFNRLQEMLMLKLRNVIFKESEMDILEMIKMMTAQVTVKTDIKLVDVVRKSFSRAQPKECFNNAFKYLSGKNGTYILGYLIYAKAIPIEHAWVKEGEQYLDVTLKSNDEDEYYQVLELTQEELMEYVNEHNHAPSIFDWERFKR